jgi:formylglycine-generating enzyme required for sulfatase activity
MTAAHRLGALRLAALGALLQAFVPAGPAHAQEAAPKPAAAPADLASLRRELEETYLQVQRDFAALTGDGSAVALAGLEQAVAKELDARKPQSVKFSEYPDLWTKTGLLGPVVARRLSDRVHEVLVQASGDLPSLAEAMRSAVRLVFPEPTMADNWDKHFLDLEVVQRWAKANAGATPSGDQRPEPGRPEPGRPASPPAFDPSDMVQIPRGDLLVPEHRGRGWPNLDQKAEKRTVKSFYIDRTEVTCASYAAFLHDLRDAKLRERIVPTGWKPDEHGLPLVPEGVGALPVTGIPYEGAAAFAASLGKRLPSEDEWERAARGNPAFKYPWGNEWVDGNAVAGGKPGPAPAGSTAKDRSPFGVMDLAGNVSELCASYPDGKPVKGLPKPTEQVVRRGGNYRESPDEAAGDWRYVIGPTARTELVGFRCAMDEKDYERRYGKH